MAALSEWLVSKGLVSPDDNEKIDPRKDARRSPKRNTGSMTGASFNLDQLAYALRINAPGG